MNIRLKLVIVLFLSLWITNKSFATEQVYDTILYNDTIFEIFSDNILQANDYPFASYIPIFLKDTLNQHKFDKFSSIGADDNPSSSYIIHFLGSTRWCLRGYIGSWEIRNDSLILNSITDGAFQKIDLDYLFEGRNTENGVFADWYSGFLRVLCPTTIWGRHDRENIAYAFVIRDGIVLGKLKGNRRRTAQTETDL